MGAIRISVLDAGTLGFPDEEWSELSRHGELALHDDTAHETEALVAHIGEAEVVFTNKVPLTAEVFQRCPHLRFIGVLATGYNIIDLEAAKAHQVTVCNVPGYSTASTSQHAVALILELCNQVGRHNHSVHEGDWTRSRHFSYWLQAPMELEAMTVGIVGFGTIGRRVAAAVHAMGARIVASARRHRDAPHYPEFEWLSNEALFEQSDLVSLHCPETPENSGFVNAALLGRMKKGAMLVNTARGGLVNEADLAAALRTGQLAGAALDVVKPEPMAEDSPLLELKNCLITPHIAWASAEARKRLIQVSQANLLSFLDGSPVNKVV